MFTGFSDGRQQIPAKKKYVLDFAFMIGLSHEFQGYLG
jgi:hypothetical protein